MRGNLKVKIKEGQKNLPKGSICEVYKIDVVHLGVDWEHKEPEVTDDMDEDDEAYLEENAPPPEPIQLVQAYFLVADKKGKFVWIEIEKCRKVKNGSKV